MKYLLLESHAPDSWQFSKPGYHELPMIITLFHIKGMSVYIKLYFENLVHDEQMIVIPWWHHEMEIFSMLLALCEGNTLLTSGFSSERPVTQSFDVYFDLHT